MRSIILDTDLDTDCDDAGALATLHALTGRGEANILAVVCNTPTVWAAPCVDAVNTYYGRPEIPVGTIKVGDFDSSPRWREYYECLRDLPPRYQLRYNEVIAKGFPNRLKHADLAPDAVTVYRQVLSSQPDRSVTICAVGFLAILRDLLESEADEHSPLSGRDLVEQKVDRLVTMALGSFPEGADTYNWRMEPESAEIVIRDWPTTLVVSEWGQTILTGARLFTETGEDNPIRKAYEVWHGGKEGSRCSWDQVAVLYAVRGTCYLFAERTGHRLAYCGETYRHRWVAEASPPDHRHLQQV